MEWPELEPKSRDSRGLLELCQKEYSRSFWVSFLAYCQIEGEMKLESFSYGNAFYDVWCYKEMPLSGCCFKDCLLSCFLGQEKSRLRSIRNLVSEQIFPNYIMTFCDCLCSCPRHYGDYWSGCWAKFCITINDLGNSYFLVPHFSN